MKELPSYSEENPWMVKEKEILKRRDLRNSHLIFSIDPKGCEDVDDALSVRYDNDIVYVIIIQDFFFIVYDILNKIFSATQQ